MKKYLVVLFIFLSTQIYSQIYGFDFTSTSSIHLYNDCDSTSWIKIYFDDKLVKELKIQPYKSIMLDLPTNRTYFILCGSNYRNNYIPKFQVANGKLLKDLPKGVPYFLYFGIGLNLKFVCPYGA